MNLRRATFFDLVRQPDKARGLLAAAQESGAAKSPKRRDLDPGHFRAIPGTAFAYQLPNSMVERASRGATLQGRGYEAKPGIGATVRFYRLYWEARPEDLLAGSKWIWMAHGTPPQPFYKDTYYICYWLNEGHEAKADIIHRYPYLNGNPGFKIQSERWYGKRGLAYGKRTSRFTVQVLPPNHAFSFEGYAIFGPGDERELLGLMATLNASAIAYWLNRVSAQHKLAPYVNSVPIPELPTDEFASLARRGIRLQRVLLVRGEVGNWFVLPALLQVDGRSLADRAGAWAARVREAEDEIAAIQAEIDERCFELYGIDEEDRRAITEGFGGSAAGVEEAESEAEEEAGAEDEEEPEAGSDTATLAAELVAWAVGVAFGRFDVRLATGERELPGEPEPFDPLPVCSPAMLTGDDGLPLEAPPAGYPIAFPADGILVDDPGHPRDLVAAVRAVFDVVFGPSAEAIWQEAAELLDPRGHDLRSWLRSGFFEHHLKRHSKSRRKAPILWQLAVPSARYSTWCYAHRLTRDSLFALARDVVAPKVALEERRHASLVQEAGPNPTARQRAEIEAQAAFATELRVFADEVRRVAPLWNPDLDDGIVLVAAPLWRLVPAHRAWQKELKSHWDDLVAGKYDWAHLAMHLWPERVVPKCATDRSLAIAHGLEGVFWAEGADGKWTRRAHPTRSIGELVAERTSPAVKAALADLLAAPAPAGAGGRRRKGE